MADGPQFNSDGTMTEALDAEWFSLPFDIGTYPSVVCCLDCGALLPFDQNVKDKHWSFHLQVTGNVHR